MQLVFDERFNEIIEDIELWNEVPNHIILKIKDLVNNIMLYDYQIDKCICPICLNEIYDNHCKNCSKTFEDRTIFLDRDDEEYGFSYFVFDIQDKVYLYELEVNVPILSKYYSYYKEPKVSIKTIYRMSTEEVSNIKENKIYSFKEYYELLNKEDFIGNELFDFFSIPDCFWLYVDNLEDLKNTKEYKYSNIWILKDYFNKYDVSLSSITYWPIYRREFEYLIKMGLYNMALSGCEYLNDGNTFKSVFGIDKKYYNFMKKINIKPSTFNALKIYPTYDIELLKFMENHTYFIKDIVKYVDIKKLKEYFEKQNLLKYNILEYHDYINWCEKLGFNLKDKKILFPLNFMEAHDRLQKEIVISKDKNIEDRINSLSSLLSFNKYEDDKYIIFPANSIDSLLDESRQMHNCVRTYVERYSKNECQIYFMRYKDSIDESLVTIEVIDNKVVQAREKYNENINEEEKIVINKFEKNLLHMESI